MKYLGIHGRPLRLPGQSSVAIRSGNALAAEVLGAVFPAKRNPLTSRALYSKSGVSYARASRAPRAGRR